MTIRSYTGQPLVVAYGVGRDSTALLVELHRRGVRPDAILFADTGGEKRQTYEYLPVIGRWLAAVGFPPVTVVRYAPRHAPYRTLEGNMVLNATLPGATFNRGSCTMKYKVVPQTRWTRRWPPALDAWRRGQKVLKLIGFEADEGYRLRRADARAHAGRGSDAKERERFAFRYPLMDWGYDLNKCVAIIESVGLPVPVKSACFFCPNQKPQEVHELSEDERSRAMLIEVVAEPYNRKVRGLWRRPRKCDGRPGSITEYVLDHGLSFTPLTVRGERVVLNPNCRKARTGGAATFDPPHEGPTLRGLLEAAGHAVPEVVVPGADRIPAADDWREPPSPLDARRATPPADDESDAHLALAESL